MRTGFSLPPAPGGGPPEAVVFDVDGTLYRQAGLRRRMLVDLLAAALASRQGRRDLRILKRFREDRERLPSLVRSGFEEEQYRVPAESLGIPPARVREAVERWIHVRPLRHLRKHRTPGIAEWMDSLRSRGVRIGVYSDYPARDKLEALGLTADAVVDSADPRVDALKPDPRGLLLVLELLGAHAARAIYVGDRDDRDRPCAESAGTGFLHVRDLAGRLSPDGLSR